jgi:hypothetical protein
LLRIIVRLARAESPPIRLPDSLLSRCFSLFYSRKSRKMGNKQQSPKRYAVFYADKYSSQLVAADQVGGRASLI